MKKYLVSTISGDKYPFDRLSEFADNGESLEVKIEGLEKATVKSGASVWERFDAFLPFDNFSSDLSLGEGDTPLLRSDQLGMQAGLESLWLKNETANPTWSFKDRGSLACTLMTKEMGESVTATLSTGNMGASVAAFGARAGIRPIVFILPGTSTEKIRAMDMHGATIVEIAADETNEIKQKLMSLVDSLKLRIVSGNGTIRVEGYKFGAFEIWEQFGKKVPDFVAVPTSACGHIRGLFKGFRELQEAGLINKLPRMIVAQAANCSPLVTAMRDVKKQPVPFVHPHTIATAISAGNPTGGSEILDKAARYEWLGEDASEEEILDAQKTLAQAGFFVEPSSATTLVAVRKLRSAGKIGKQDSVVLMLTGSGLKDNSVFKDGPVEIIKSHVSTLDEDLGRLMANA